MEENEYQLRCSVRGHTSDVRVVKPLGIPGEGFITGSRDKTVRVWQPSGRDSGYEEVQRMTGATNFISALCTLPPSPQYPCGVILAGSHDGSIYGYTIDGDKPLVVIPGHSGAVTSMAPRSSGMFISGSWDKTARVWLGQKCLWVLEGHQEAVWAVEVMKDADLYVTASADKTIRLWDSGSCVKVFTGHEHCVRGIVVTPMGQILSCSNDHTVRLWTIDGECVDIFYGHEHYVYGIALLNEDGDFVTSGEDGTAKIWRRGVCVQSILLPAQSLWSVTCLENGDILVGGSDFTVRVFTKRRDCIAPASEMAKFEDEVKKSARHADSELERKVGDFNMNDLPGPDVLKTPGIRKGQTVLCREGDKVNVFEWNDILNKWMRVGEVVGARDSKKKPDYVFKIDTDDGRLLDLPYNLGEDPWMVAENFIKQYSLPSEYLTKISNFIVTNTPQKSLIPSSSAVTSPQMYCDPFTGNDRHIPTGSSFAGNGTFLQVSKQAPVMLLGSEEVHSVDNTRADSLQLPGGDNPVADDVPKYFPLTEYVTFDATNIDGMKKKLIEFNDKVPGAYRASVEEISELMHLAEFPETVKDSQLLSLDKLMSWPEEYVFPVLDLFRLAARSAVLGERISQGGSNAAVVNYLTKYMHHPVNPTNARLAVRTFCNFFCHEAGRRLLSGNGRAICFAAARCVTSDSQNIETSVAALFQNYSAALYIGKPPFACNPLLLDGVKKLAEHLKTPDAVLRLLVCIGTLMEHAEAKVKLRCPELERFVKDRASSGATKDIKQCAELLARSFER